MNQRIPKKSQYNLRSGLVLYPTQQEKIEKLLTDLIQQIPASFILLADVTGQVVSTRGDKGNLDLVAIASLVAGDLAASHEIARLTGQYQDYQMVLREGETTHTFIGEAGHYLALMIQISKQTPLGWARMLIQRGAKQLADIAANPPKDEVVETDAETEKALKQEDLSDLFDDALDDLWLE